MECEEPAGVDAMLGVPGESGVSSGEPSGVPVESECRGVDGGGCDFEHGM